MLKKRKHSSEDSESDDIQCIKDLGTTKLQLNSIFDDIEQRSLKLIQIEKDLKEKEKEFQAFEEEKQTILNDLKEREERIFNLEKKLSTSTTIETKLGKNQVVKLNVGGKIFATNLATITSVNDTFFTGYFNDLFNPTAEEDDNSFFIDRPNEQFHLILNYLRGIDIKSKLSSLNEHDLNDFIEEIVYYQLTPIYEILPINGKKILTSKYSISTTSTNNETATVEFDSKYCSSNIQLETPTRARKTKSYNFDAAILGTKTNLFRIKIISKYEGLMIGFAPKTINIDGSNYNSCGYYLYCYNGNLYSERGDSHKSYINNRIVDGSIIECELRNGNISFKVNDKDYGVAFSEITNEHELYPAFNVLHTNCTFEFINDE